MRTLGASNERHLRSARHSLAPMQTRVLPQERPAQLSHHPCYPAGYVCQVVQQDVGHRLLHHRSAVPGHCTDQLGLQDARQSTADPGAVLEHDLPGVATTDLGSARASTPPRWALAAVGRRPDAEFRRPQLLERSEVAESGYTHHVVPVQRGERGTDHLGHRHSALVADRRFTPPPQDPHFVAAGDGACPLRGL